MKHYFDEEGLEKIAVLLRNLNYLAKSSGVILDSESPIRVSLAGRGSPFTAIYNDAAGSYDLCVGVPL